MKNMRCKIFDSLISELLFIFLQALNHVAIRSLDKIIRFTTKTITVIQKSLKSSISTFLIILKEVVDVVLLTFLKDFINNLILL